jgi:uncharacterized protein
MSKTVFILVAVFCVLAGILIVWQKDYLRTVVSDLTFPYRYGFERERNIMVPMRDGKHLNTMFFKPSNQSDTYPAILVRTTYGAYLSDWSRFFVENGYVVVVQSVRGRNGSEGDYTLHQHSRSDGYDTIDWIIKQKWSNGKVGTFGCSYLGESQIILSAANHPNHIAMIADGAGGAIGKARDSYGYFGFFENGVLNLASALGWFTAEGAQNSKTSNPPPDYPEKLQTWRPELPVARLAEKIVPYPTGFEDLVTHPLDDPWWEKEGYIHDNDTFSTASLHVNTWYDQTVQDTFRLAEHMAEKAKHPRARHQYVLIDPGNHCEAGKLQEGLVQVGQMQFNYIEPDFSTIYLNWFDYWLKDRKVELPPRFKFFVIHAEKWMTSTEWPPRNVTVKKLYLREGDSLKAAMPAPLPEEELSRISETYRYDPLDPVPTLGGSFCCTSRKDDIAGAVDQSPLKSRNDVLVFSSEKFQSDIDIIGNVKATLFASTSALDTDFTIKLVDQHPDGQSFNIQDGVIRLRYRNGIDSPQLAEPGKIYKILLELRPTAYRVKKGHQLSLYISSSNFPRLARNLNTGEAEYTSTATQVAENTIYRSSEFASHIEIPVFMEL